MQAPILQSQSPNNGSVMVPGTMLNGQPAQVFIQTQPSARTQRPMDDAAAGSHRREQSGEQSPSRAEHRDPWDPSTLHCNVSEHHDLENYVHELERGMEDLKDELGKEVRSERVRLRKRQQFAAERQKMATLRAEHEDALRQVFSLSPHFHLIIQEFCYFLFLFLFHRHSFSSLNLF